MELERGVYMDASTTLANTQALVIWTMLGFLLVWMVIFAVLAFYPYGIEREQSEQRATSSSTFPVTPVPLMLHVPPSPPVAQPVKTGGYDTDEMEAISMK
jgi:hypothetical protein